MWKVTNCKMWAEELEEQSNLCVLKELFRKEFEATCVRVRRKNIRKNTDEGKGRGVQQSCRWRWGDGEV